MNETINILIVDDEIPSLTNNREEVLAVRPNANVFTATNYIDALKIAENNIISIALLDVEMPEMLGVDLAKKILDINPNTNIIFVTAYKEYAFEATQIYSSGYLLKPVNQKDIKAQFKNLRHPLTAVEKKLTVHCFGNFDVHCQGVPLYFERQKGKEVLAYLIDRRGARSTMGELISVLYENSDDEKKNKQNFYSALNSLKKALKDVNLEDVLVHSQNAYAINTELIDCDYYKYLDGDEMSKELYRGQYMHQYSWSEFTSLY